MKSSQSPKNAFERLYEKPLTKQQVAEMKFNLSKYIETLMQMDEQHKKWLKEQANSRDENNTGRNVPPEVIN